MTVRSKIIFSIKNRTMHKLVHHQCTGFHTAWVQIIFNAKFSFVLGMVEYKEVSLEYLRYFHTEVCSQISGDLYRAGTSKLICEANRWTGSYVMRFLLRLILHLCGMKIYYSLVFLRCEGFPGTVSDVLGHHRVVVYFSLLQK